MVYNIKHLGKDRKEIKTLSPKLLKNDISYTANENWGQGRLTLPLDLPINDSSFTEGDYIDISSYTDEDKTGTKMYSGFIDKIVRTGKWSSANITLECLGIFWLLSDIVYKNGTDPSFTKNDTAKNILIDIITYFNSQMPVPLFDETGADIEDNPTVINVKFDKDNCYNAFKKVAEVAGHSFYLWALGEVISTKQSSVVLPLTYKTNIEDIKIAEDRNSIKNKLVLTSWALTPQTFEDTQSQTDYWLIEIYINNSDLGTDDTMTDFGNNYIEENKDPKSQIDITVNDKYPFFKIRPTDLIKVQNLGVNLGNRKVVRLWYRNNRLSVSLGTYLSTSQQINKGK